MSKCPSCGNLSFRVQLVEPGESNFKLYFIQCSSCGVPVGITEYYNSGALIRGLEEKLSSLSDQINHMNHNLMVLEDSIRRMK